jgi:hypothetical protein
VAHTTGRVGSPVTCVSCGIRGRTPGSNGWNDVGSTPTPPFFSLHMQETFPFRNFPLNTRVNKSCMWYYLSNERRR